VDDPAVQGLTFPERARACKHGSVEHSTVVVEAHDVQIDHERSLARLDQQLF